MNNNSSLRNGRVMAAFNIPAGSKTRHEPSNEYFKLSEILKGC